MVGNADHKLHGDFVDFLVCIEDCALVCQPTGTIILRGLEKDHLRGNALARLQIIIKLHLIEKMRIVVGGVKWLNIHYS